MSNTVALVVAIIVLEREERCNEGGNGRNEKRGRDLSWREGHYCYLYSAKKNKKKNRRGPWEWR
jgi:hypothetical protein